MTFMSQQAFKSSQKLQVYKLCIFNFCIFYVADESEEVTGQVGEHLKTTLVVCLLLILCHGNTLHLWY